MLSIQIVVDTKMVFYGFNLVLNSSVKLGKNIVMMINIAMVGLVGLSCTCGNAVVPTTKQGYH
jgi:uncharacterized membrane protein YadS